MSSCAREKVKTVELIMINNQKSKWLSNKNSLLQKTIILRIGDKLQKLNQLQLNY